MMLEIEVQIPAAFRSADVAEVVERVCAAAVLTLTMKSTLAQYPDSVHWHLKRGKERGTLEVTWWPPKNRLWFKVAAGRTGDWITETVVRLKKQIEGDLQQEARLRSKVAAAGQDPADYLFTLADLSDAESIDAEEASAGSAYDLFKGLLGGWENCGEKFALGMAENQGQGHLS